MPNLSDARELRRQLEEPLTGECRNYPTVSNRVIVTMLDTPYYPPFMPDVPHYHNYLEIGLCVSGNAFVRLQGKRYSTSAGSIILAPRGVYHNQEYGDEQMIYWRYLVINDDYLLHVLPERYHQDVTALLESIASGGLLLDGGVVSGADALVQMMFDLRRLGHRESTFELEMCAVLLLQLIARGAGDNQPLPRGETVDPLLRQPIEPALAYVYAHYKEDIRIEQLARSCSMSESYFRKLFQRIMGQPPLEYVNRYRIHRSLNLLRTTTDPIQHIAIRAGFSSIAAYNRNFIRYVGESPTAWRHSHLNK